MVLDFLGALCPEFSKARPHVIGSFIVKSLEDIYHLLREDVPSESQNPVSMESRDRSALTVQGRTSKDRGCGSDFECRGRGRDRDGGRSGRPGGEVIYCYYYKESTHTKYNCPLLQENQQQFQPAHIATPQEQSDSRSSINEEQMKEQLYQVF